MRFSAGYNPIPLGLGYTVSHHPQNAVNGISYIFAIS